MIRCQATRPLHAAGAALLALVTAAPRARADEPAPVAVGVSGSGCPDRAQLVQALRVRGLAVVEGLAPFRLDVAVDSAALHLVLRDADRAVVLERTIDSGECGALAETVAMLVERRLAGVAW